MVRAVHDTSQLVGRAVCGLVAALLWLAVGAGCNQNAPGRFGTPWGDPAAAQAAGYPNTSAGRGLFGRRAYVDDLQSRADEQSRLALQQQQRLAQLEELQQTNDAQLAQIREQSLNAQAAREQERIKQEQLVAQRAREALGRYDELDKRADGLNRTNQDLHTRMAQVEQRNQLLEDQNLALRQRLEDTNRQLTSAIDATRETEQRMQTLTASSRRRSGAAITANNSYRQNLTAVTVAGLSVRQDGELVRIELPTDRLFEPGTARLRSDAAAVIDQAADVILNHYSRQVIGVEAHTDNSPLAGSMWRNSHQLTAAQAMSVFEQLSYRHRLLPQQLFVLGHGENYPLSSNATPAGQARNRRVEIVIYPEVVGQR